MSTYIVLFVFTLILGFCVYRDSTDKKRETIFVSMSFISMAFIQMIRDESIGEDTINYIEWFQDICKDGWIGSFISPTREMESGYKILNLLIATFTENSQVLIAVTSLCILYIHFLFLKKNSKNVFISVILLFGLNHFLTSMTTWRQYLAMGIAFWIYPNLIKHHYKKVLLLIILAFSFHKTSLVFCCAIIGAYIISKKCISMWLVLILEMVFLPFVPKIIDIVLVILPKYTFYFTSTGEHAMGLGKLRIVYIFIEIFLLILISAKKKLRTRENIVMGIMLVFSIYISVLNIFVPHIFRLGYYFDYFLLLVIPTVIPERPRNKYLIQGGIVLSSFILFVYFLVTNAGGTVPYKLFI